MGADIKALRNRIKSVNSTLHLTKAMGLVASSKIRRAGEAMQNSKLYVQAFENVVNVLAASPECANSPFTQLRGERTKYIVIAGDRGLAGGYNANVFRLTATLGAAEILPIGKRACDRYGGEYISSESFDAQQALRISQALCQAYCDGEFDRLIIVYTQFVSMMTQQTQVRQVLPLQRQESMQGIGAIVEPDETTILTSVIPEFVAGVLSSAVKESYLSEVAARRAAMDAAGKNAQQMIDDLQIVYNRARQSSITQEITEIIAGSGA